MLIGIDAGGSLIKIAYSIQDTLYFKKFASTHINDAAEWVSAQSDAKICLTGGKDRALKSLLTCDAIEIDEFDATNRGVQHLLQLEQLTFDSYILTNVGTGTSLHYITNHQHSRIGGSGVGGGTLMGLSYFLTGHTDFGTIVQLAATGERDFIDLKVHHIYVGKEPPIPGDLTASNFGNLTAITSNRSYSHAELLATVVGLVAETVTVVSLQAAQQYKTPAIVYIGSTFVGNEPMKEIVDRYTKMYGFVPVFFENGDYSGAIGALVTLNK